MIFAKMSPISKWQRQFLRVLFRTIFALRGRLTFTNLARFCPLHEQTFRRHFQKGLDWVAFNTAVLSLAPPTDELIAALDCTFLPKSGTQTYGLDRFWSAAASKPTRGLEVSVVSLVQPESGQAFTLDATQTPPALSTGEDDPYSRIDFYLEQVTDCLASLDAVTYVVADGQYAKTKVFNGLTGHDKHLITRLRSDANLRYRYTGPRKSGPGAPKQYDGKVQFDDLSRFTYVGTLEDKPHVALYTKQLNSPYFKRDFRVVVLVDTQKDTYVVLASTDPEQVAAEVVRFYRLRFQIELIFRDAKQFAGLAHCQARSQAKLDFHVNMSFAAINLARLEMLLDHPDPSGARRLSMNSYVRQAYNRWLVGQLLSELGLLARFDLNHRRIQRVVRMGSMAR